MEPKSIVDDTGNNYDEDDDHDDDDNFAKDFFSKFLTTAVMAVMAVML